MADLKFVAHISDPVHGSIGLTEIEREVLATPVFQRLRNVKQLGLAHLVFPGCDQSRFAHSLGACHVIGQTTAALELGPQARQHYRLAALLHDCGHYPFSHATEGAITSFYAPPVMSGSEEGREGAPLRHEQVGKEILERDERLRRALTSRGIRPEEIHATFTRERPPSFANLLSSDLDADRIDYLLRTSHHSGLPYGAVDFEYLLAHLKLDGKRRLCFQPKTIRAIDHFLLSRFFDRQQVAFNKTVVGLEWLLRDVVEELLRLGDLDCTRKAIFALIDAGEWADFDDGQLIARFRDVRDSLQAKSSARLKAAAILARVPPKLAWEQQYFAGRTENDRRNYERMQRLAGLAVDRLANEFRLPEERWHVWHNDLPFTKATATTPMEEETDPDDVEQTIRVLAHDGNSQPISRCPESLMKILADQAYYSIRIYVLLGEHELDRIGVIKKAAAQQLDA